MSQGAFVISKYQEVATPAKIHKIQVQEETLELSIDNNANTAPAAAITEVGRMKGTKGTREYGKSPMKVHLTLTGDPPTGYAEGATATLSLLNNTIQAAALVATEATPVTYLETTWRVTGTTRQKFK